jgi:hypothetical protein
MADKYTVEQVIEAIRGAKGILTVASNALGCSRTTVHNYVNKYPTVKAAYEEASETLLDFTEQQLYKQVADGNITAIIFTLKTKGKHRGYVERQEVTGANGGAIETRIIEVVKDYGPSNAD